MNNFVVDESGWTAQIYCEKGRDVLRASDLNEFEKERIKESSEVKFEASITDVESSILRECLKNASYVEFLGCKEVDLSFVDLNESDELDLNFGNRSNVEVYCPKEGRLQGEHLTVNAWVNIVRNNPYFFENIPSKIFDEKYNVNRLTDAVIKGMVDRFDGSEKQKNFDERVLSGIKERIRQEKEKRDNIYSKFCNDVNKLVNDMNECSIPLNNGKAIQCGKKEKTKE